ncbi:MAG: VanZ family protein [Planctomycetota bacterium]
MTTPIPPTPDPVRAWHAAVRRPWRIVFVIAALIVTTTTHWPQLTLPPTGPSDKTTHLVAFGTLTFLFWRTGWIRARWLVVLIMLAWSALDEVTQGIPALGRHVSSLDLLANVLGVLIVGAWLWALKPVGRAMNMLRLRRSAHVVDVIFRKDERFVAFIAIGMLGAGAFLVGWKLLPESSRHALMLGTGASLMIVGGLCTMAWWRQTTRDLIAKKTCFECGTDHPDFTPDDFGFGTCTTCGQQLAADQWSTFTSPRASATLHAARLPAVIGLSVLPGIVLGAFALAKVYEMSLGGRLPSLSLAQPIRTMLRMPMPVQNLVDITIVCLVGAVLVALYRRRVARHYDQAIRCRACGHDLRGASMSNGQGRCGECGVAFMVPTDG